MPTDLRQRPLIEWDADGMGFRIDTGRRFRIARIDRDVMRLRDEREHHDPGDEDRSER